jgi:hypothetical protein
VTLSATGRVPKLQPVRRVWNSPDAPPADVGATRVHIAIVEAIASLWHGSAIVGRETGVGWARCSGSAIVERNRGGLGKV